MVRLIRYAPAVVRVGAAEGWRDRALAAGPVSRALVQEPDPERGLAGVSDPGIGFGFEFDSRVGRGDDRVPARPYALKILDGPRNRRGWTWC